MIKKIFVGLAVLMVLLNSCDKIEGKYTEDIVIPPDGSEGSVAVLFEFTGWDCTNCPGAHREIAELKDKLGKNFLPISIHAGNFAVPCSTCPDFRTVEGTEIHDYFSPIMYPIGAVNGIGSDYLEPLDSWGEAAVDAIHEVSQADVHIKMMLKDSDSKIEVVVKVEFTLELIPEGKYWLGVYLTEDKVIGPQKDGSTEIEDYEHEHMFRASFNGAFGEEIAINPLAGEEVTKTYTIDIKKEWKAKDLDVVPFIYKKHDGKVIPFRILSDDK